MTRAASTVRAGLKEPAKSKAMSQEVFSYNAAKWEGGKSLGKNAIDKLTAAGK